MANVEWHDMLESVLYFIYGMSWDCLVTEAFRDDRNDVCSKSPSQRCRTPAFCTMRPDFFIQGCFTTFLCDHFWYEVPWELFCYVTLQWIGLSKADTLKSSMMRLCMVLCYLIHFKASPPKSIWRFSCSQMYTCRWRFPSRKPSLKYLLHRIEVRECSFNYMHSLPCVDPICRRKSKEYKVKIWPTLFT